MGIVFAPLALLYGCVLWFRNYLFDWKLRKVFQLPCKVISVGNVAVGGTGKTPWTIYLAMTLKEKGYRVGVVSRGYKRKSSDVALLTTESSATECGDEPLVIALNAGVPVCVGANRYLAGLKMLESHSLDVILLDDGFQHRSLHRDLDIVLMDSHWAASNYHLLPWGRLREGMRGLSRADLVVFNKWTSAAEGPRQTLTSKFNGLKHSLPILSGYVTGGLKLCISGTEGALVPGAVAVASGIANPKHFLQSLEALGVTPQSSFLYRDHYPWTGSQIKSVLERLNFMSIQDLVVTEKDWVKMKGHEEIFERHHVRLWTLPIVVEVIQGAEALWETVSKVLGAPGGGHQ